MSKHTPGPWTTIHQDQRVVAAPVGKIRPTVAECISSLIEYSERKANARLIAAAPELLEALKDMLAEFDTILDEVKDSFSDQGIWEKTDICRSCVVELIAKAEGN
jgi:hypothetical protein